MSALSRQLQQLKVAGQPSTQRASVKKRPSLLFDQEEAAAIDVEAIHDLGCNGLGELARIDGSFREYEDNLFSEKCINHERSLHVSEDIQELDETIGKFLRQLSPYLMLRATHKCMEWLIRVFRINSYNVDDVMRCILPYHDTVLFARVVQLLPLKDKTSFWHWLRPSQKEGCPLSKAALIQHCLSVPAFLNFVCSMLTDHKISINFYCSTVIGVISNARILEEWLVVMVIQHITRGLKSLHAPLIAASYIILAHVIQQTTLSSKVLNSLLSLMAKHLSDGTVTQGVMMLCYFCKCQHPKTMSNRTIKYLSRCTQLVPTLADISTSHDLSSFTGLMMMSLIKYHFDKMTSSHDDCTTAKVVVGMITTVRTTEAIVVQCMGLLVKLYMNNRDLIGQLADGSVILERLHNYCEPIVRAVDNRYPSVVDVVIGDHLSSCDPHHVKWSQDFVAFSLPGVSKHHVVMDTGVVAALGVYHGSANVRKLTLLKLCQQLDTGTFTQDNEFISSAVLSHLHDNSNLVVENAVNCCLNYQEKILEFITVTSLIDALLSVMGRARSHDPITEQCLLHVMSLLMSVVNDDCVDKMLLRLLSHLLYHYHDDVKVVHSLAVAMATLPLAHTHPLLIESDQIFCSQDYQISEYAKMSGANCYLIGCFVERMAAMETSHLTNMVMLLLDMCNYDDSTSLVNCEFVFAVAMLTSLLSKSLPQLLHTKIANGLVAMVSSLMPCCVMENVTLSVDVVMSQFVHLKLSSPRKQAKFVGSLVLWVTYLLAKHLVVPDDIRASLWLDIGSRDPSVYQQYCMVLLLVYHLLIQLLSNTQQCADKCHVIMMTFISVHFQGRGTLLRFLAMIWCSEHNMDLPNLKGHAQLSLFNLYSQISSLRYALAFLEAMGPGAVLAVGGVPQCPMVPALLVALLKPDKSLRQAAMKCFQLIHTSISVAGVNVMSVDMPFLYLCDVILQHRVELEADQNAVVVTMAKELDGDNMTSKSAIAAAVEALMYHVTSCETPVRIQYHLLTLLSDVRHKVKFDGIIKMLRRILDTSLLGGCQYQQLVLYKLIECYSINNSSFITDDALFLLTKLLSSVSVTNSIQQAILQQISSELYSLLSTDHQQFLLSALLECCLDSRTTPTTSANVGAVINKLPLDTSCLLNELQGTPLKITSHIIPRKTKRRKIDTSMAEDILDKSWKRISIILDAVSHCASPQDCYQLVPNLFELLESCLELGMQLHHIQLQLLSVLSWAITMTTTHMGLEKTRELLPESQFNVDVIIQSIRSSSSTPQLQQHSLSLLSVAASVYPVRILHNIMSIFTFMGAYLSHHDDQYSFEVVLLAMDNLLPILMSNDNSGQTSKKSANQVTVTVVEIIRVFSDAVEHIPYHRQLIVFEKLVTICGVHDYLHVTLSVLIGKLVAKQPHDNQQQNELIPVFCKELSVKFSLATQVTSLHKMIKYISHLPDIMPTTVGSARKVAIAATGDIFDVRTHSTKQIRLYKLFIMALIIRILSCDELINKVNFGLNKDQELIFLSLLQVAISYIVTVNTTINPDDLIVKKCYSIVDHVTHLLPMRSYVEVMSQLITPGTQCSIQKKCLDIMCSHLMSSQRQFALSNVTNVLTLLPLLNKLIQSKQLPDGNKVSAISLITVIICRIGSGYHDNITEVIPHLIKAISSKSRSSHIMVSSMKCISEMVKTLGGHFIPHLPHVIPLLLAAMTSQDCSVAVAATEAITIVMETLPKFLSPYISDVVRKGCCCGILTEHATLNTATEKLRAQLATNIPSRLLVPSLVCCYEDVTTEEESILAYLQVLHASVMNMSTNDVSSHSNTFADLFIKLLHYRSSQQEELSEVVEDRIVECFTDLVVKMSENTFRPVFLKLCDWATLSKNYDHITSFYHLADQVAGKLKGLFLLFAGHMIPNCVELLKNMNGKDHQLQQYLLSCLTKCFHYDTVASGFLTTNRFGALLEPLVGQVSRVTDGNSAEKYLVPCLVEFAAATTDDSRWKALNHELLLYSKDDNSLVRRSLLHVLLGLYDRLGESLLVLLPETIPFLAELLEDEDEQVEHLCQKFIKIIELLLGESIQHYF